MKSVLLLVNSNDTVYSKAILPLMRRFRRVKLCAATTPTWSHVEQLLHLHGCDCIATTRYPFFNTQLEGSRENNLGYVGNYGGVETLYLPDLVRIYTEPQMKFLVDNWLTKLSNPELFVKADPFSFEFVTPNNLHYVEKFLQQSFIISVDIETVKDMGGLITHVAYTGAYVDKGFIKTRSFCVQFAEDNYEFAYTAMRRLNGTKPPKVMQNGQYDATYFLVFAAPLYNYIFDTYNMQHCMFAEIKANIGFMVQMYTLGSRFWKEMAGYNKAEYNARDTHATLWAFLGMLKFIQKRQADMGYAIKNYLIEFQLIFPCLQCGLEGIKVDEASRLKLREAEVAKYEKAETRLRYMLDWPSFNPGSSDQVLTLMKGVGFEPPKKLNNKKETVESSDKKAMQKFSEAHPLYTLLVDDITQYRKAKKAVSTYYDVDLRDGRLLYQIDPAGTETGRCASKASNLWCGTQIQNMPSYAKGMLVADEGWELFEVDGQQAESRTTAYISQDENLIQTVETSPDFHCTNASLFFGIAFDALYQCEFVTPEGIVIEARVLMPEVRKVAKSVNHGANYNMGWFVLWETMGTKNVLNAARLLRLPRYYTIKDICLYLLDCFNRAYPRIKGEWYAEVVHEVLTTGRLVGPDGWTRRTFLRPDQNKSDLNACVAHHPQSASVMQVNRAFYRVWRELQHGKYPNDLRLKAQIHDSIFGQTRVGMSKQIVMEVSKIMESETITVHGRTFRIPNDPKYGKVSWKDLK